MTFRKWKPNAAQKKAFAELMADPVQKAEYLQNKTNKQAKKRIANNKTSQFDYSTAGGMYIPTKIQYDKSLEILGSRNVSDALRDACDQVFYGYINKMKIHHDHIHIINEKIRESYEH